MFIIIQTQVYLSKSALVQVLCWTRFSISKNDTLSFFRCEYHHNYNTCCHGYYSILFFLIRAKYFDVHHCCNSSVSVKISIGTSCWTRFSVSKNDTLSFFRCEYHHNYNTCCHGYYSILFFLIRAKYFDVHHCCNSSISVKISIGTSSMLDQIFHFQKWYIFVLSMWISS